MSNNTEEFIHRCRRRKSVETVSSKVAAKFEKSCIIGITIVSIAMIVSVTGLPFRNCVFAYDITDKLSIGGVLAGAYQYQTGDDAEDTGRGAIPFQAELSFRPTQADEISVAFGFAAGNGLNDETAFISTPWAADLEDDVEDINGRGRDYLLTAWYGHVFHIGVESSLALSGGIIDSTSYIDGNAYANDEYTQFMNGFLVNASVGFFPSYDIGGVLEWEIGNWKIVGLGMNVGENDDGDSYNYFATQISFNIDTNLGEGNYRFVYGMTDKSFSSDDGEKERLASAVVSFDQKIGENSGAWIRLGWQDDKAVVDHDMLWSGGLNIDGDWYGRKKDDIGIGYAYLHGRYDVESSQVAEIYWRVALADFFAVTTDVQYIRDEYKQEKNDVDGFIFGIRGTADF